jgi:hypothetical protein
MHTRSSEIYSCIFFVQVKGYQIFDLLQRNFANALDFENIMHKARLDMIQLN